MKFKKTKLLKYSKKDSRKKMYLKKPFLERPFFEIDSPHNINDYLINVNSNEELNLFSKRRNDTTKENTYMNKDKEQKGKEICKINSIKF